MDKEFIELKKDFDVYLKNKEKEIYEKFAKAYTSIIVEVVSEFMEERNNE